MYRHENTKRSHPYPSIRAVLMIAVCTAMIPPSVIIVLGGFEHGAQFVEQVRAEAVRQTDAFAEIQIVTTESTRQLLQTLASLPAFKNDNLAEMTNTLKSVHGSNADYVNLTTVDDRGVVSASSLLAPGVDLSQRRHIRSSLLERRFVAGEYFLNLVDSQPSFAFSAPIFDNAGKLKGSISATIRLDAYSRRFDRLKLPNNANLRLLDRNGVRLYVYPKAATTPIGMPIKSSVWNRILEGGEQGTFEDVSSDGIPRIFAFRSLTLDGSSEPYMYVVYATPKADVVARTRSLLSRNIFLMIGVTIFSLLCAVLLSRKFLDKRLKEPDGKGVVSLGAYAELLTGLIADSWKSSVDFSIKADDIRCSIDTAVPFGLVLNELVVNAFKHAFKDKDTGHLTISIRSQDLQIILEVADDGPGLPPSFSIDDSPGLGLRIAQASSLRLSGSLTWSEGGGARFRLSFPIPDTQSTAQA